MNDPVSSFQHFQNEHVYFISYLMVELPMAHVSVLTSTQIVVAFTGISACV